jgi:diaminopimelate epimerase
MKTTDAVTISMGKPITAPVLIPVRHRATPTCINQPFTVNGAIYRVTCVSFGTPYGAVLVDDVDSIDLEHLGYSLGTHALFPQGASIVFLQILDKTNIKARLWHRDYGVFDYAPEAACVAFTVAVMLQKMPMQEGNVHMGNNVYHIERSSKDGNVRLTMIGDTLRSSFSSLRFFVKDFPSIL